MTNITSTQILATVVSTENTEVESPETPATELSSFQKRALAVFVENGEAVVRKLNAFFDTVPAASQAVIASYLATELSLLPTIASVGFATAFRLGCFPGLQSAKKVGTTRASTITFNAVEVPAVEPKRARRAVSIATAEGAVEKVSASSKRVDRLVNEIEKAFEGISLDEQEQLLTTLTTARDGARVRIENERKAIVQEQIRKIQDAAWLPSILRGA
jgi:hypothetical protein